jgi:hypothetical protein
VSRQLYAIYAAEREPVPMHVVLPPILQPPPSVRAAAAAASAGTVTVTAAADGMEPPRDGAKRARVQMKLAAPVPVKHAVTAEAEAEAEAEATVSPRVTTSAGKRDRERRTTFPCRRSQQVVQRTATVAAAVAAHQATAVATLHTPAADAAADAADPSRRGSPTRTITAAAPPTTKPKRPSPLARQRRDGVASSPGGRPRSISR